MIRSGGAKCMHIYGAQASMANFLGSPSFLIMIHYPCWAANDPANGHKFISSEPVGRKKRRHKKRERQEGTRLLCALLEKEMDHG